MDKSISHSESIALTYIRVGAMISIILCHICQTYAKTNRYAYILNIGVQVFLALSGYLYGRKNIFNWKGFWKGRIIRLYIPMVIFLVIVLPLYLIFHRDIFSWKAYFLNFLNLQGISFVLGGGMILGIRHLWFLTAIMFAYFMISILQRLSKFADFLFPILLVCIGIGYLILPGNVMFFASWLYIFAICYLYNHLTRKKVYEVLLLVMFAAMTVYMCRLGWDVATSYFNRMNRGFHDVGGIFAVIWGVKLLSRNNTKEVLPVVKIFDEYSFPVYIVHYLFIIGPFSLARITSNVFLNICLMLFASIVGTVLLVLINNSMNRILSSKSQDNKI